MYKCIIFHRTILLWLKFYKPWSKTTSCPSLPPIQLDRFWYDIHVTLSISTNTSNGVFSTHTSDSVFSTNTSDSAFEGKHYARLFKLAEDAVVQSDTPALMSKV